MKHATEVTRIAPLAVPGGRMASAAWIAKALVRGGTASLIQGARLSVDLAIARARANRSRRNTAPIVALLGSARRVLVVCHANRIRSAFAMAFLADAIATRDVKVASAGLAAVAGRPAHPMAVEAAATLGVRLSAHRSTTVVASAVAAADVIFVMDLHQLVTMRRRFPHAAGRTFLLTCLASAGPLEIDDPVGSSASAFATCFQEMATALRPIVDILNGRFRRTERAVE